MAWSRAWWCDRCGSTKVQASAPVGCDTCREIDEISRDLAPPDIEADEEVTQEEMDELDAQVLDGDR